LVKYLEVASVERRFLAGMVDGLVLLPLQVLASGLRLVPSLPWGSPWVVGAEAYWVRAVGYSLSLLIGLIPGLVYFLVLECVTHGLTLGKKLAGIRVVEGAHPASARACAVRNVLRAVDYLPFSYGVGILSMSVDKRNRRVGDRVADTVVIRWPIRDRPEPTPAPMTVYPQSTRVPGKAAMPKATRTGLARLPGVRLSRSSSRTQPDRTSRQL